MFGRNKIAMLVAEFLGTGVLTAVVLAITRSNIGYPYFVALGVGLALAVLIMTFGAVSGAHFNPAITLGLWSARRVKTLPAVVYIAVQLAGAMAAYLLYTYFVNSHWPNSGKFASRVLVAEATGAFVFALGWATVVYQKYEGAKAAFTIGAALAVGMIVASVGSGAYLNPAVALGVRNWGWGTYALGPVLGAVIGFNLYALLFAPREALMEAVGADDKPAKKKK
jgi:glycerol uptake facilitator-like aquaporin